MLRANLASLLKNHLSVLIVILPKILLEKILHLKAQQTHSNSLLMLGFQAI